MTHHNPWIESHLSQRLILVTLVLFWTEHIAIAQNGSFIRIAGPDLIGSASGNLHLSNFEQIFENFSDGSSNPGETLARGEGNVQEGIDVAFGSIHAEATSISPCSIGNNTFSPQANTTGFVMAFADGNFQQVAEETYEIGFANSNGVYSGDAVSNFLLNFPDDVTEGIFHGTLYLVGIANGVTTGPESFSSVTISPNTLVRSSVTIGDITYSAQAVYLPESDDWQLTANLPDISIDITVGSVNHHFNFELPVADGTFFSFSAVTGTNVTATAQGETTPSSATATVHLTTSGLAWGIATPIDGAPLPGDFDGDSDVDNDDFEIWFENQPIDQGASGPQGDADLDGDIDNDDLAIWLANTETPGIPGDYNNDNSVDAADYTVWRNTLGSDTDLSADGDLNGIIENLDI